MWRSTEYRWCLLAWFVRWSMTAFQQPPSWHLTKMHIFCQLSAATPQSCDVAIRAGSQSRPTQGCQAYLWTCLFKMEQVKESHICVHETIFLCQMDHFLLIKKILIGLCVKQLLHVTWLSRAWRHVALTCLLMECPYKPREFSSESHGMGKQRVWHLESLSPSAFSGQRGIGQER